MRASSQTLILEHWIEAGLHTDGWTAALQKSAKALGARALCIAVNYGPPSLVDAELSPDARRDLLCFLPDRKEGADEADEQHIPGLGLVARAHAHCPYDEEAPAVWIIALFDGPPVHPHLCVVAEAAARGAAIQARLNAVQSQSALKMAAFDVLPIGVAIVDAQLNLAECNDACRHLLARRDGLVFVHGRLSCLKARDQTALLTAVDAAFAGNLSDPWTIIRAARSGGERPYILRPIVGAPDAHCLLMIVDPDGASLHDGEIWRAMFDLTDCELIIAEGIVSGQRINEIADQRGVSVATIRTQTKRMFARLNVSSQAAAAVRLSRAAPFRKST